MSNLNIIYLTSLLIFIIAAFNNFYLSYYAIIKKKTLVRNIKWIHLIILILCLPVIIISIKFKLNKINIIEPFTLIYLSAPVFYLIYLIIGIFYFFKTNMVTIYCTNVLDFRNSVISYLRKRLVNFNERMNEIELIDLKNKIKLSYFSLTGKGSIILKNNKDSDLFKDLIKEIRQYFNENKIKPKMSGPAFYLITGIIFLVISIVCSFFIYQLMF